MLFVQQVLFVMMKKIPGEPFLSLDLLGGAVKSSSDRPKEFQIFTVSDSAMFSCDSKTDTDSWLQLLNGVCEKLVLKSIHGDQSSKEKSDVCSESANENRNKLLELMKFDGNNVCADCNFPDPDWASINLGIFICLECSGFCFFFVFLFYFIFFFISLFLFISFSFCVSIFFFPPSMIFFFLFQILSLMISSLFCSLSFQKRGSSESWFSHVKGSLCSIR